MNMYRKMVSVNHVKSVRDLILQREHVLQMLVVPIKFKFSKENARNVDTTRNHLLMPVVNVEWLARGQNVCQIKFWQHKVFVKIVQRISYLMPINLGVCLLSVTSITLQTAMVSVQHVLKVRYKHQMEYHAWTENFVQIDNTEINSLTNV